jgi:hypothetical protein
VAVQAGDVGAKKLAHGGLVAPGGPGEQIPLLVGGDGATSGSCGLGHGHFFVVPGHGNFQLAHFRGDIAGRSGATGSIDLPDLEG